MTTTFHPSSIDLEGFQEAIRDLRKDIDASLGEADIDHLKKMERWGRLFTAAGLATAGIGPNPVSALCLAVGRSTRWMVMHHVAHRGYDNVPGIPANYTSQRFARGYRRFIDWPDWMVPEAWMHEHNVLHHSYTGEKTDPDLVERNMENFNASGYPKIVGYAALAFYASTWKFTYYAPKTLKTWLHQQQGGAPTDAPDDLPLSWGTLVRRCYLPYATLNFGLLPALFLPFGPLAWASALTNSILAEVLTNIHTFCVVGPNHSGEDLYRFATRPSSRAEAYVRQVIGSVNYAAGSDVLDFSQMWLNYQIEHHVFPDIPMLQYQRMQPKLKAICERFGVPYVQENVFRRVKKLTDVFLGKTKMRQFVSEESEHLAPATLAAE